MRFLGVFLVGLVLAGSGCSHKKAKPAPAAPTGTFSAVPGVDTPAPPRAEPKIIPFGAPTTPPAPPETAPVSNAPSTPALPVPDTGPPVNPAPVNPAPANPAPANQKLIVTPEQGYIGKVATVNDAARFVIVTFPAGHVPPIDQTLNVYRNGLKVGELKVTEPQRDEFTAADIVTGETAVGDEVRDK